LGSVDCMPADPKFETVKVDEAPVRPAWAVGETEPVSDEAASWAVRLFLGREPKDGGEIAAYRGLADMGALRKALTDTAEFKRFLSRRQPYRAPLFLIAPPADPATPWRFEPPSLSAPVSQLCTHSQMLAPEYREWLEALNLPSVMHRKFWEFAYILAIMRQAGVLAPGKRALGFGVGKEPVPSLLAKLGLDVVASDAPPDVIAGVGWETTNQHSSALQELHHPAVVDLEIFNQRVSFRPVDMNAISDDLTGFDVCWSSCAFEHLGSLKRGLDFVENSLKTLKPGGLAVHTTEFNLDSNAETVEAKNLSIFRRRDFEELASRLVAQGHTVLPLNFHPGDQELDAYIDAPPFSGPHLKVLVGAVNCTSIGVAVFKGAN